MSSLFGSPKVSNNAPVISSLRVQTSCNGKPIPLLYGKPRVAVNVVQYEDFQSHAHTERAAGGKGGGGAPSTTSWTYTAAIIMAIGQGPILGVSRIWKGKEIHDSSSLSLDVYTGADGQTPFPFIASKFPDRALAYPGIAYLAAGAYELGSNAQLENHNVEVDTAFRISPAYPDCDPSVVIADLVTHPIRGLRLTNALADLGPFWAFCRANGLWVSPAYTEQRPAREMIQQLIDIGFADAVYSENRLKIVPYSDVAVAGNGATYEPNRAPVYELTEDDFIPDGSAPPVQLKRKHGSEAYNYVQVKYYDRANDYNEQVAEDKDPADIELRGLRPMPVVEAKEICTADAAARLANFKVRRSVGVRNTYTGVLSWKHALLEPTDIVLITLPAYQFDRVPVMITRIEEDEDGRLTFEGEDYALKATAAVQVPTPSPGGYVPDFSVAPGNANIPTLFEPPYALTGNRPELWLATAGGDQWGGAEVWVSLDNASYRRIGRIEGPSRHGSLSAPLPAGAAIDIAHLLQVDLSASRGQLLAATHADAESLTTLSYVDGEYLAYADASLTGVNTYNLGYLVRGAHGSDNVAHAAGTPFVRLDDTVFRYPYAKEWLGKTAWIKLVSFNRFGSAVQQLSEVPAYPRLLEGAPMPAVSGFRFEQPWSGRDAKLAWEPLDGAASYDVQVLAGLPVAIVRESFKLEATRYTYGAGEMAGDGGPWRTVVFRVRGRSETGRVGPWSQLLATNPQIGPLTGIKLDGGMKVAYFSCARPADGDFAGILVWVGETPDFSANPTNLAYDGPGTFVTLAAMGGQPLQGGKTYYVRAAGYDEFGKDDLSVSAAIAVDVVANVPDANTITEEMLKDGILTAAKFAQGIAPVAMVDTLPPAAGYTGPAVVFNKADGKLYRYAGGAWVKEVDGTDIKPGSVNVAQFASGIEPVGVVTSLPAVAGYTGPKVVLNTTDGKTYRLTGGAWKKDVDAADIAGQLQAAQIAAGAVDLTKLASGLEGVAIVSTLPNSAGYTGAKTVFNQTDGKLYRYFSGGWVASTPTSDLTGQISAAQIAANAVTAEKIAADAVTAGTIAAGAISAREIQAGAITATKLVVENRDSACPDPSFRDPAFWTNGGGWPTGLVVMEDKAWPVSRTMVFTDAYGHASVYIDSRTFPIELGATYRYKVTIWKDAAVTGAIVAYAHFPEQSWFAMGVPTRADGKFDLTAIPSNTWSTYTGTFTNAATLLNWANPNTQSMFHFDANITGGNFHIAIEMVRAASSDLIVDGAITTNKILANAVTANQLAAGSVTAEKIQAGAITAGKIAAGAVSATEIASKAITADKMLISDTTNLCQNPGFEDGLVGWINEGSYFYKEPYTANARTGLWCATRPPIAIASALRNDMFIPVAAGEQFYASAWVKRMGTLNAGDGGYVRILFINAAKVEMYSADGNKVSANSFALSEVTATIPAGVSFIHVEVIADNKQDYLLFDDIRLQRVSGSVLIQDGAVVANKVATGAITAGKIAADAVTAGTVAAGAINAREIAVGAITANKLAIGNFDNLIKDPEFYDLLWWGRNASNSRIGDWTGQSTWWNSSRSLYLAGVGLTDTYSGWFPIEPGATYRLQVQVNNYDPAFNGRASIFMHIPGVVWHTMGCPDTGKVWGTGEPVEFNTASLKEMRTYTAIYTVPSGNVATKRSQIRIMTDHTAGLIEIGGISVVRVSDATLIQDGAISTQKLTAAAVTTDKLAANSVTADKLVANVITGDKIAANAITGSKIAAGEISADHMMVGQSSNMLVNPGMESSLFQWSQWTPVACTIALNAIPDWTLAVTSNKTVSVQTVGGAPNAVACTLFQSLAVQAGKTYLVCAYIGAHRCMTAVDIEFYDAAGARLTGGNPAGDSANNNERTGGKYLEGYKRIWLRAKAPPGAVTANAAFTKFGSFSGHADSWMFMVRPYFGEVQPNQTTLPAWDAAGATIIGPGNISTDSLSAISANIGDITSGRINLAGSDNYIRSNYKNWGDGANGFILAKQSDGSTYFDVKNSNARFWSSSWGDCGISFPNFRVDNSGNLYCRGDIQANSLTANIVNTPHMVGRSVSDSAYAGSVTSWNRLYFTLQYDCIVLFGGSGIPAQGYLELLNSGDGVVVQTGSWTSEVPYAVRAVTLGAGGYSIRCSSNISSVRDVFALWFKR